MCGIAGIFGEQARGSARAQDLAAMIERIAHRGPDGRGFFIEGAVALAHARLSIIDVAGGDQPIFNEDRSACVVFNGEIFNFVELREALLARGHRFATRSDTEVIVHLYEEHGDDFVRHLNGQFAIALWDARRERLLLARDRVGIRPLFHAMHEGRFVFASEMKAILALPGFPRALDRTALAQACTYWSALPPRTAFEGIAALPPGHTLVVDSGGQHLARYWDWSFPRSGEVDAIDEDACAEELHALLADAVRLQLRSDVPVGAYLSGGLDSAIIAALVNEVQPGRLRTFSLAFEDPEFDESAQQREMVAALGTRHTSVRCSRRDIAALFPRTVFLAEAPIVRTAPAPLLLLSGHVREAGYKVVLTGEGADEVFGGYDLFKEAAIRRFWAREPGSTTRHRLLERLYPYLANSPVSGRAFTQAFFREGMEQAGKAWFAHIPRWTTTARIARFFSAATRERLGAWNAYDAFERTLPPGIDEWIPMGRDQYVEAHTLMTGYLLCSQGDRMAMGNSIEGRFPFLDHRVIEFANRLPAGVKLRGLHEKHILRKSARGLVPEAIRTRMKQPYRAPDSQSFFEEGRPAGYVGDLLCRDSIEAAGYFDSQGVGKLLEKCRAGRAIGFADNMAFVAILSTMLLHEQLVMGRAVDPPRAANATSLAA